MAQIDLLSLLIPYGQRQLKVKAKATGYTDSDMSNVVTYYSRPHVHRKDGTTLQITNCRAAATNYEIYLDGTKVGDAAYSGADGGTLDVDVTSLGFTSQAINKVYVKGTGTGVENNQSETFGFWYGENVILGVSGLYQSEPALTRTDDAVGLSWAMSNNLISSDFDDKFPFNQMQRETIDGDVFVYVPAMYWRIGYDSNHYITDIAVAPAAMAVGENQILAHSDAFYYGAYGARIVDGQMRSVGNGSRSGNYTRAQFREYAKAHGAKYRQLDLYHMRILDFLWLIEFATKNSDAVMQGLTSYGGTCGSTDSLTVPSGQLSSGGRMRWRYIEDFIGNGLEFFDGLTGYKATDIESNYTDDTTTGELTFTPCSGYFKSLKIDPSKPFIAIPQQSGGSTSEYYCDYAAFIGSAVYCRGRYYTGSDCGLFYVNGNNASYYYSNIGSRLLLTL